MCLLAIASPWLTIGELLGSERMCVCVVLEWEADAPHCKREGPSLVRHEHAGRLIFSAGIDGAYQTQPHFDLVPQPQSACSLYNDDERPFANTRGLDPNLDRGNGRCRLGCPRLCNKSKIQYTHDISDSSIEIQGRTLCIISCIPCSGPLQRRPAISVI